MTSEASKEQIFAEVRSACTGLIGRIALSYEANETLRRELIQDIFLAVWVALPSYRGEGSLKAFVASIAQKRAISHMVRRAREPKAVELPHDLASPAVPPDEAAMRNDQRQRVVKCIQKLPIPQREAIVLMLEGFTNSEIGQVLGITTNAATLRCQRAKESLKSIMEGRE